MPKVAYVDDADGKIEEVVLPDRLSPESLETSYGHPCSTDGTDGLPLPTGVGLEFVITADGLDDIRFGGVSL